MFLLQTALKVLPQHVEWDVLEKPQLGASWLIKNPSGNGALADLAGFVSPQRNWWLWESL